MKTTSYIIGLAFLVLMAIGCGSEESTDYRHIPGDAVSVAKVDLPALVEKSNINHIRDSVGFGMLEMGVQFIGIPNILKDRSRTGIDFSQQLYTFNPDTTKASPMVLMFYVADEDSLHQFIEALDKGMFAEEKEEVTQINFSFGTVVYKKNRGYFTMEKEKSVTALLSSYFELEKARSFQEKQPEAVSYLQGQNDVGLWSRSRDVGTFDNPLTLTGKQSASVDKSMVALNFDKGRLTTNYREMGDEALTDIYQEALDGTYKEKLIRGLPGGELPAIISTHVQPATYRQQMANLEWYEAVAEGNGYTMFTAKRFGQMMRQLEPAFSGSSIWSIMGYQADQSSKSGGLFSRNKQEKYPSWHIAIDLDKPDFADSLITTHEGSAFGSLEKRKAYHTFQGATFPFHLAIEDQILYITNDEKHLQQLLTTEMSTPELAGTIHADLEEFPVYINVSPEVWSQLLQGRGTTQMSGIVNGLVGSALVAVERITVKAHASEAAALNVDLEMSIQNKDRNALEMLITSLVTELSLESLQGAF